VRAAMPPGVKLLAVEFVVPDDDRQHPSTLLDLKMLLINTGRNEFTATMEICWTASAFASFA
jgi:hypothetical protein